MEEQSKSKKTVYRDMGFNGFGSGENAVAVDVEDGRIVRIRPLHLDEKYEESYLNRWTIEARGHVLQSPLKTTAVPFGTVYKQRVYSRNRVPYPMKRVDWDPNGERHPENRGQSDYVRISWDEATDIIASEIRRCIETYGPTSIFCQGDGHGEGKVMGGGHGCNTHLMNLMGGFTLQARQPDSWEGWYWGAKYIWGMDPVGEQVPQDNLLKDILDNTDCTLMWGCDPETTPWGWGGQGPSMLSFFWTEIGIKQIYICPDVNYGCAVHADKWIPVLPNTDAALQLGIAYTWIKENLYDKEYVETHSVGFDWFERYVMGGEDGVPKTPKWAEGKCGVPARQIKALARYWAARNVTICHCNGGGYIRSAFSTEPARLEVALLTMQALGKPGRNQFAMTDWALYGMQDLNPLPPIDSMPYFGAAFTGHAPGTDLDYFIPQTLVPDAILLPEGEKLTWYGHVVAGLPRADQYNSYQYPREGASRIHMFWTDTPCWSTCWNGGNRIHDALRDPSIEFMLVQHPWLENDTYYADIILPVSTLFEQTDVGTAKMCLENDIALYKDQAVLPVGEAKTDSETVLAIAEKLGKAEELMEHWCYPKSAPKTLSKTRSYYSGVTKINEEKYPYGEPSFETLAKIGFYKGGFSKYMEFDEFKEKGYLPIPFKDDDSWKEARGGLYNFYADPENNPLDTPSGKIEFYSTALAQVWGDDPERPPVPHWIEESESHHERLTNDRGKDYPFLLVSNHPHFRHHAMLDDVAWFRELDICKVDGPDGYKYEPVWMNPADARRRGLKNGDIVRLYNERGSVLGGLLVTERIMENTLSQDHGARVDGIVRGSGGLDRGGANNLICPGKTTSKNAAGEVTNGFLVNVEKVDVFELAKQYPEEFGRDYRPEDGMQATARIVKEV